MLYVSVLTIAALAMAIASTQATKRALVYRGPAARCDDDDPDDYYCSKAAKELLKLAGFQVDYIGPAETLKITSENLDQSVDIYLQPGGGDHEQGWHAMKRFDDVITNYVREGGRFAGICLGAYLAGQDMGFGLTPPSSTIVREIEQPGSKVKDEGDTTIDLSWSFQDGTTRPENIFFQDGAAIIDSTVTVLGTYSSNGDIAASLNAYGKGWVALSGCHVEADEAYYKDADIPFPSNFSFATGLDFVAALMNAS